MNNKKTLGERAIKKKFEVKKELIKFDNYII